MVGMGGKVWALALLQGIILTTGMSAAWGASARMEAAIFPGTERIRFEQPISGGSAAAELYCARNEYESFQVMVAAREASLEQVRLEIGELRDGQGTALPPSSVVVFREVCIPVRHSAPRASQAPGLVPDALVPVIDPYTGAPVREARWRENDFEGTRFGGMPFNLWRDRAELMWVDVYVPKDTGAGTYTGVITVSADNADSVALPVRLTVWDFTLPDGPTHENHFGGLDAIAEHSKIPSDSEAFYSLEARYMEMMAAHRLNPPIPARLRPVPGDDGTVTFRPEDDGRLSEFVAKYHLTNFEIPRAPFAEPLEAGREKALRFYRSWYAYLEGKGWAPRSYVYMLDEPNTREAYDEVRKWGTLLREAHPGIRRLVVEQTYTQDPAWGDLDASIDIWCPLFGFVHEPSIRQVQARGGAVWSYTALVQTAPPYHPDYETVKNDLPPFWALDFPLTSYRIAPWLNRRYAITGLLYWSTVYWGSPPRNPWHDPGFRIRWNGEGALFYPGQEAGLDGPVASMRLKNLRDGMEDYEYLALLDSMGGGAVADEIVRSAVPTWGTWNQDPKQYIPLRQRLAEEILERQLPFNKVLAREEEGFGALSPRVYYDAPSGLLLVLYTRCHYVSDAVSHDASLRCLVSRDLGRTWETHTEIPPDAAPRFFQGLQAARLKNGALITSDGVSWQNYPDTPDQRAAFRAKDIYFFSPEEGNAPGTISIANTAWMAKSLDDGKTWSRSEIVLPEPMSRLCGYVTGGIVLSDGETYIQPLWGTRNLTQEPRFVSSFALRTVDGGARWQIYTMAKAAQDPDAVHLCEPCLTQAPNGDLVALIRTAHQSADPKDQNVIGQRNLYTTLSKDFGITWSEPRDSGLLGSNAALVTTRDGLLVATYARRGTWPSAGGFEKTGIYASVSRDNGASWAQDETIELLCTHQEALDANGWSAALPDGSVCTVYTFEGIRSIGFSRCKFLK